MNIAQPLSELLKSKGVSRSKLARDIGVHTSTVSNWIDGKDVKPDNLSALCEYFECTLDFFAQKEKKPAPISESELDSNLIKLLVKLTPDEIKQVDAFVQGLIAARKA